MEAASRPTKISRIHLRYRHQAQDVSPEGESVRRREAELDEKEDPPADDTKEPLLIRERKGRSVMGRAHRMFHRRKAEPLNILTVAVEVVATVDSNGNVIAQETITHGLPSVPAVPSVSLPQVPSVPAFPSDLTVPAYPWPSGVPSVAAVPSSSPALTSAPTIVTPIPTTVPASLGFNSTISSTISSSSILSTTNSTSSSSSSSRSSSSSSSRSSTSSTRSSTTRSSTSASSTPATSTSLWGGGGGGPANTAPAPTPSATAAGGAASNDSGPLDTPKVVGSVIGSLAGAAVLLALLLFLIKRHKKNQRGGAMELPDTGDSQPIASSGRQMATRSSFVPAGAAAFFNRFSGASRSTAETSTTGERGFQRISGRKLPSAFSEGMTSEQFARGEGTLSGSSFYKDDSGFYGGPGAAAGKEFGKETGEPSSSGMMGTKERIMPSPARTPVIHHPEDAPPWGGSRNGGSALSPPHSPNPDFPPPGTLGRSHPSHDGSRSSRFTENV